MWKKNGRGSDKSSRNIQTGKNAINRLKKIDTTVGRAQFSNYCDGMVLNKGTQSIIEPVTSEGIVKKSSVDDISKRDEFLPDLDDNMALSLIHKSFTGDHSYEMELDSNCRPF